MTTPQSVAMLVHVVDAVLHYTLGFAKLQCIPKKTVVYYDYCYAIV